MHVPLEPVAHPGDGDEGRPGLTAIGAHSVGELVRGPDAAGGRPFRCGLCFLRVACCPDLLGAIQKKVSSVCSEPVGIGLGVTNN